MLAVSPPKQLPVSNPIYTHSSLLFVKNSAVQRHASANATACDSCPGEIAAALSVDFIIVRPAPRRVSPAIALSASCFPAIALSASCFPAIALSASCFPAISLSHLLVFQNAGLKEDELLAAHPELKAFYKYIGTRPRPAPAVSHVDVCSERKPTITAALSGLNRMS
jgi:hypothetical protein